MSKLKPYKGLQHPAKSHAAPSKGVRPVGDALTDMQLNWRANFPGVAMPGDSGLSTADRLKQKVERVGTQARLLLGSRGVNTARLGGNRTGAGSRAGGERSLGSPSCSRGSRQGSRGGSRGLSHAQASRLRQIVCSANDASQAMREAAAAERERRVAEAPAESLPEV